MLSTTKLRKKIVDIFVQPLRRRQANPKLPSRFSEENAPIANYTLKKAELDIIDLVKAVNLIIDYLEQTRKSRGEP